MFPMQGCVFYAGKPWAFLDQAQEFGKERMIAIGIIEPVIAIGPVGDQLNSAELAKLVLHRAEGESAHPHQLAHIAFLSRGREKQSQDFGANSWKQDLEDFAFWFQMMWGDGNGSV